MRTRAKTRGVFPAILGILIWFTSVAAARAWDLTVLKLKIDGQDVALKTSPLSDGREVYLPLTALRALGCTFTVNDREDAAQVTFPSGKRAEVGLARLKGQQMAPLSAIRQRMKLQAEVAFGMCAIETMGKDRPKQAPEQRSATIQRSSSLENAAERRNIASAPARPKQEPIQSAKSTVDSTLIIPLTPIDTARGDVRVGKPVQKPIEKAEVQQSEIPDAATKSQVDVENPDLVTVPAETRGSLSSRSGAALAGKGSLARTASVVITDISLQPVDTSHARVKIATNGRATPTVRLVGEPARLVVDVPNSVVDNEKQDVHAEHPLVSALHATPGDAPGSSRVTVDLSRVVGYRVLSVDNNGVTINLSAPRGAGLLRDSTIVIDPGHGGPAHGCYAKVNGQTVFEKNITLAVAKKFAERCRDAGMNVIMTRTDDRDIPLSARPGLANDNNADMFVSIHVDDCDKNDTASGSTSYYHYEDESSRALAHVTIENIAKVSGLPNRRARSDRTLYEHGLSVLRNSQVPATLVELGFMNNSRDRHKLMNEHYQNMIADAMFEGIRTYVEGSRSPGEPSLPVIRQ